VVRPKITKITAQNHCRAIYDVMSAAPYPEFPVQKMKLAMAIGNKGYYRLQQIQLRHFYQTGHKAGLPKSTSGPILAGMNERAGMICHQ